MLKGPRITLRAITRDDLPRYVAWFNDVEVIRHLTAYLPMNPDNESEWYDRQRKDPTVLNFAIETETGEHIGSVGLMYLDHRNQSAELGIVIGAKEHWGKGYGREAITVLLEYGFHTLNLNRIALRVDADHPAAIRCYKNCGFVMEGEMRQVIFREGKFFNQYLMSVLREEYEGESGKTAKGSV